MLYSCGGEKMRFAKSAHFLLKQNFPYFLPHFISSGFSGKQGGLIGFLQLFLKISYFRGLSHAFATFEGNDVFHLWPPSLYDITGAILFSSPKQLSILFLIVWATS